eukprot:7263575-Prymnesium_polylepis.1
MADQSGRMQPTISASVSERPPHTQPSLLHGCLCRQPRPVCSKMALHSRSARARAATESGPPLDVLCLMYLSSTSPRCWISTRPMLGRITRYIS